MQVLFLIVIAILLVSGIYLGLKGMNKPKEIEDAPIAKATPLQEEPEPLAAPVAPQVEVPKEDPVVLVQEAAPIVKQAAPVLPAEEAPITKKPKAAAKKAVAKVVEAPVQKPKAKKAAPKKTK